MNQNIARVIWAIGRKRAGGVVDLLGTCFAVAPTKFATAAHVTGPSDEGLSAVVAKLRSLSDYQDTTENSVDLVDVKLSAYDAVRDIAIVELPSGMRLNFDYTLDGSDNAPTGTSVVSLGFPHVDTGRLVLTEQASMVGARLLLGSSGLKTKHIVLNTQARPGQSGGPVLSPDGKRVHAMIIGGYVAHENMGISLGGVDPRTLHQTTHAVSAEYIASMI